MAAPKVRKLNQLVTQIGKSIAPQTKLIEADIARAEEYGKGQEAGLRATADETYGQIEQSAQDKGMFFSGFSPEEKARYNATTFLPALAQLQETIASTRSNLLGKKADLQTDVFNKAFDTREGDIERRYQWRLQKAQNAFERAEAKRAYQRELKILQKTQAFQASEGAKDRAAAAGPSARENAATALQSNVGKDGYVSPGTWKAVKNHWIAGGYGSGKQFNKIFKTFKNPKNPYYR